MPPPRTAHALRSVVSIELARVATRARVYVMEHGDCVIAASRAVCRNRVEAVVVVAVCVPRRLASRQSAQPPPRARARSRRLAPLPITCARRPSRPGPWRASDASDSHVIDGGVRRARDRRGRRARARASPWHAWASRAAVAATESLPGQSARWRAPDCPRAACPTTTLPPSTP